MKVSVIIPAYNSEEYIKNALESVIKQSLKDIEIIVVDDCSTDKTAEIVKQYIKKDGRIKLISLGKNRKQGYCRQIGINFARSPYITFLDSDDEYEKDFLKKMYKKITSDKSDMVICNFCTKDYLTGKIDKKHENLKSLTSISKKLHKGFTYKDIKKELFYNCNVIWDKIYRRDFLIKKDIKFPFGMYYFEDDVFLIDTILKSKKISILNKHLVCYTINRPYATSTLEEKIKDECFFMFDLIEHNLKKSNFWEEFKIPFLKYKFYTAEHFYQTISDEFKDKFLKKYINSMNQNRETLIQYFKEDYNDDVFYNDSSKLLGFNRNVDNVELKKVF